MHVSFRLWLHSLFEPYRHPASLANLTYNFNVAIHDANDHVGN